VAVRRPESGAARGALIGRRIGPYAVHAFLGVGGSLAARSSAGASRVSPRV